MTPRERCSGYLSSRSDGAFPLFTGVGCAQLQEIHYKRSVWINTGILIPIHWIILSRTETKSLKRPMHYHCFFFCFKRGKVKQLHIAKNVWIWISLASHFSSQSLRYPYFQVGQILGPHPQSQEVKNARPVPQKQLSEPKPTESKVSTDTRKQQQHPHQPLQQIPLPQTEKPAGVSNAVSISAIQSNIYAIFRKRQ